MAVKWVEVAITVPEGSEEFFKKLAGREMKGYFSRERKYLVDPVNEEIEADTQMMKQLNGLLPPEPEVPEEPIVP